MATLYYVIYPSAKSAPSATQVKTGKDADNSAAAASGSESARDTAGEQVFASAATGLTGGTSYKVSFVWSDGTNDSNVVVSSAWATWNTGALAATESGSDAAAIAGDVLVSGTLAATESGADVAALAGKVLVSGSLAATESGADTAAIAGQVLVSGSLAASEAGDDTAAFDGFLTPFVTGGYIAATEVGADVAAIAGRVLVAGSLAANESGDDTAALAGKVLVSGYLDATESGQDIALFTSQTITSGSLAAVETGEDTASFAGAVPVVGYIAANESPDTAAFTGTVPGAASGVTPAGKSGRGKRRRIVIRERVYEVPERDIPALLEAELLDRAPPVTAEVIEGPKPPRKRAKKAPRPVKTVEQVRETVQQIKRRIEPDDAWLAQALEAVAFRVLERLQDEEDSLMLLLAA